MFPARVLARATQAQAQAHADGMAFAAHRQWTPLMLAIGRPLLLRRSRGGRETDKLHITHTNTHIHTHTHTSWCWLFLTYIHTQTQDFFTFQTS